MKKTAARQQAGHEDSRKTNPEDSLHNIIIIIIIIIILSGFPLKVRLLEASGILPAAIGGGLSG